MKYIYILIILILLLTYLVNSKKIKEFFHNHWHLTRNGRKFYKNKKPLWLCFSDCNEKDFKEDIFFNEKKKKYKHYVTRIKQLYGTNKSNYIKGNLKGNLLSENLLKYSAKCNSVCKPVKYSKYKWDYFKKHLNPGIWKILSDKEKIENPLHVKPSNLILCKSKCKPTNKEYTFKEFIKKMEKTERKPILFRTNKDLYWGKYHPLPELSNRKEFKKAKIMKCKEYCKPFNYSKKFINFIKKKNKKLFWDKEIYSPKMIKDEGILRTEDT